MTIPTGQFISVQNNTDAAASKYLRRNSFMKKFLALVLCLMMALSMVACANAEGYSGEVKIWVAENTVDFTKAQVEAFKAEYPEYAGMTVIVEPVGEGDAATNMLTDVEAGADIFGFAQDQLNRLVAAGALVEVAPENAEIIAAENDAGAVGAVTMGDVMYAYPMTSDNGYFLYYDKSVVTDPTSIEAILADCEAAGKNFYMEINSGWYQTAFFFGAGCTLTYSTDDSGNLVAMDCNYASENGVKALKSMIKVAMSPAFVNGSSAANATNLGAIVDGTWDAGAVQQILGENYAAVKLPTVDGYQLGGFGGFKMLGVKPQIDDAKLAACDALALYLTSESAQTARFEAVGWGPSNLKAQQSEGVKSNVALSALADQLQYTMPQGQYPGEYWTLATALGDDILADKYDTYTDDQLMDVLVTFQTTAGTYLAK
ncbi:MAG: extracellular solute-binding protein [Clostridia bacterium]|nr:extracellular solute-binding protein [Clostridia bacterium]